MFKNKMDANVNGKIKFQMMMIGRSGRDKNGYSHCCKRKLERKNNHLHTKLNHKWSQDFLI